MLRNLKRLNKRGIYDVSCRQLKCIQLLLYSRNHSYCTSASKSGLDAVPLSYSTFQPETPLVSKIPVVILHGLLGSKQNWRGLGKAIAVRCKRKVYALDARNHGDSPHVHEMDYPCMADDVKSFMKFLSIPEAVILGHSMGGRTAMYLSLTNEAIVNKLIVVDVSPGKLPMDSKFSLDYMTAMADNLPSVANMGIVQARRTLNELLTKAIPEESVRQFLLTNLTETDNRLKWKPNIETLRKAFSHGIMQFPSVSGHFLKETLFVCGGDSPYVPAPRRGEAKPISCGRGGMDPKRWFGGRNRSVTVLPPF